MGWETLPNTDCPCGKKFSKNSFGLADPSFSYVWSDYDKNISIILLANGNFPTTTPNIQTKQGELSDVIMNILGY